MREGQHEQAILMLDEAIGIYPNHSESYLKRAEQLSRIGRLTEARMDMQTAYRLSPNTTKFLQSKGKLDKLQWIAFPEEEYLAYAANHSSFELKTLVLSSLEKKKTGDLVGAILDLELAFLLEDEESAKLHSLRGNLLLLSQNFAAATQSYDRAIELAPDQAYLYFNRGVSRIFSNERSKAGEDLEKSEDLGYKIPYDKLSFFCYY
jgi:Flp pilus assembly protein TadD